VHKPPKPHTACIVLRTVRILCTGGVSYALFISLLISKLFCTKGEWGGGGEPSNPSPPSPTGTKCSYLCTYDLYGPVCNVFDACRSIMRASGRGPGLGDFLGPVKWH
jgi:hypothetical protein